MPKPKLRKLYPLINLILRNHKPSLLTKMYSDCMPADCSSNLDKIDMMTYSPAGRESCNFRRRDVCNEVIGYCEVANAIWQHTRQPHSESKEEHVLLLLFFLIATNLSHATLQLLHVLLFSPPSPPLFPRPPRDCLVLYLTIRHNASKSSGRSSSRQ